MTDHLPWESPAPERSAEPGAEDDQPTVAVPRELWDTVLEQVAAFDSIARDLAESRSPERIEENGEDFHVVRQTLQAGSDGLPRTFEDGIGQLRVQVEQMRVEFDRVVDELVTELETLRKRQDWELARLDQLRAERSRSWWQRLVEPGSAAEQTRTP